MCLNGDKHWCGLLCLCVCREEIVAACGDRDSLSWDFLPPRSIVSHPTASGKRDGEQQNPPPPRLKQTRRWPSCLRWTAGNGHWHKHMSRVALHCSRVLKIPSPCPFCPSFLPPTLPHFSCCIPHMPQGHRGGLQDGQTKTHNTHNTLTMALAATIVCVHWGKGLGACISKGTPLPNGESTLKLWLFK